MAIQVFPDIHLRKMSTKRLVSYLRTVRAEESKRLGTNTTGAFGFNQDTTFANNTTLVALDTYIARIKTVLATRENVNA